jgi:hypothetical protein
VQFEGFDAVSCELQSFRLHVALLLGAGHVFGWWCAVGGLFCLFLALNLYSPRTKSETQALVLWGRD